MRRIFIFIIHPLALQLVVVEEHAVRAVARADDLGVAAEPVGGGLEGDLVNLTVGPTVDPVAVVVVPAEEAVSCPPRVVVFPIEVVIVVVVVVVVPMEVATDVLFWLFPLFAIELSEFALELSELVVLVGRGPYHRRLLQPRLRLE